MSRLVNALLDISKLETGAIKYTQRGRVLLRCLHEPALVRLEVLDSGIGIPADKLPYIFEEFLQVGVEPNATRDGYGLGLSIVSRIVKLLDLRLDVHSEFGNGSRFRLDPPASNARVATTGTWLLPETTGECSRPRLSVRVLLVEDDPAVRSATRMLLKAEGYEVVTAASRAEALGRVDADPRLDLLVTDYHLGGETGLEVIAALRERIGAELPEAHSGRAVATADERYARAKACRRRSVNARSVTRPWAWARCRAQENPSQESRGRPLPCDPPALTRAQERPGLHRPIIAL